MALPSVSCFHPPFIDNEGGLGTRITCVNHQLQERIGSAWLDYEPSEILIYVYH